MELTKISGEMGGKKCAHQECSCMVYGDKRYCSDYCEDAADTDPTSVCTCGHAGCK